ncbi:MAG: VCBS repeat-containing protein [Bacteroidia bacterium]|nr:VCBS repeat-containing protein [Bacteroidia bacterium]
MRLVVFLSLILIFWGQVFYSCAQFKPIPGITSGVLFENTLKETNEFNVFNQKYPYLSFSGGGIAVADFDKDGFEDLFLIGNQVKSIMYRNLGGLKFEQLPDGFGINTNSWTNGVAVADVNNDGWLDVFVTKMCYPDSSHGGNRLFLNRGNFKFEERTEQFGLSFIGNSYHAYFLDYDKDGFMDIYLLNQPLESVAENTFDIFKNRKEKNYLFSDILYHNEGGKRFKNVSEQAGLLQENAFGLSAVVGDFNQDDLVDIYVCNDFLYQDFLYINQGNGKFKESIDQYFDHVSLFSMGSTFKDLNKDGLSDLITLDMNPPNLSEYKVSTFEEHIDKFNIRSKNHFNQEVRNMVHLNNGQGHFSEVGQLLGLAFSDWSWSVLAEDFNADGLMDVFITNGLYYNVLDRDFVRYTVDSMFKAGNLSSYKSRPEDNFRLIKMKPRKVPNQLHLQTNPLHFPVDHHFGIHQNWVTTAAISADLDLDGDLDLVLSNMDTTAIVMENTLVNKNYLQVAFEKPNQALNAKIYAYQNGVLFFQELGNNGGILCSQRNNAYFAFPTNLHLDSLVIKFGVNRKVLYSNVKINRKIEIKESESFIDKIGKSLISTAMSGFPEFSELGKLTDFNDFKKEPLLPHRLNVYGPYGSAADLNGDGLMDLVVGGVAKDPTHLFLQQKNGHFIEQKSFFQLDSACIDTDIELADLDNDSDLDILVVGGGNEDKKFNSYSDRLYWNDGNGNFSKCLDCLPVDSFSGSEVESLDYDKDGDLDLFVASRNTPGRYPKVPESRLLQNTKGHFEDVTPASLKKAGMVNTCLSKDFDQDGWVDLMVAGEWMPVLVFWNQGGYFDKADTILPTGFWQHLNWVEGKKDGFLIAGNWGENTRVIPGPNQEVRLYTTDIDENGSLDPLICTLQDGVYKPVLSYEKISKELPIFRKKFLRYTSYKQASIQDCLGSKFPLADVKYCQESQSKVLVYSGNREFNNCETPLELQFSPVLTSLQVGTSTSGNPLVYFHGNFFENTPEVGKMDAGKGLVVELLPKLKAQLFPNFFPKVSGNVRKIIPIQTSLGSFWLILKNGETPELIQQLKSK